MTRASAANMTASYEGTKRRLKLWIAFIVLFMAWAIYTLLNQMHNSGETGMRLAAIEQKIAESKQAESELKQKIKRLNDPEYIQEVARKQGMIKPGEKPIEATVPSE